MSSFDYQLEEHKNKIKWDHKTEDAYNLANKIAETSKYLPERVQEDMYN
jgi:hypothetical protein